MKVLHVIGGVAWRYGGTTTTILPLCEALARLPGLSVEIAATDADGPGRRLTAETAPQTTVPLHLFRRDFAETWKSSRELFAWLWKNAKRFDLLHIHGTWSFSTAAASFAARRHGVPYVLFPQGMLSNYSWTLSPWKKRVYWRLIEERTASRAAMLHLTASGEAQEMEWLKLRTPIEFIPLGLSSDAWERPAQQSWLRSRLNGRDGGLPLVLFLSRLHPKKGVIDFLLPAFQGLKSRAHLVIAGGPDPQEPGYEQEVREAVSQMGLSDRVSMFGIVGPDDRWSAFDGADVFVLPSKQENFGLVVTEAMARGTPVVVSECAYSCEHAAAARAGRIVPLNIASISQSIDELIADQRLRGEMGERGRQYARDHLGWDRIAPDVAAMYAKCVSQQGEARLNHSSIVETV